ncbi:MAG TPA: MBL fold metallo-hydrolase [Candidatus Sulfotelmatobacter sp.]|nr:MBL fold metallo-hydrolase [Candidatus Sulfotelmatobacter sp.]
MVEEVLPDIYRCEIPIPNNPLRAINSYVIRGQDRFLMVDTGMNRPECLAAMQAALRSLAVDLARTDLFITHGHSDHVGLVSALRTSTSQVFLNPLDAAIIFDPKLWARMAEEGISHGFPDAEAAVTKHPGRRYLFSGSPDFADVHDGDKISIGRYTFQCMVTPGHTPGHTCLYEPEAKIFISGDHILDGITPNISGWVCGPDTLGDFLGSLEKVRPYEIRVVLPAHRNLMRDHPRRIDELMEHHRARMDEVVAILGKGQQTAYQVASQMAWSIDCAYWEDFPMPQKWFATGEALSHLQHLERIGRIRQERRDRTVFFSL